MQNKKLKLGLLGLAFPLLLTSQTIQDKHSILSFQVGPSWQVGDLMGLTDYSSPHRSDMRDGLSWRANYSYLLGKHRFRAVFGALYEGSRYSGSLPNSSDNVYYHYIAPQAGVCIMFPHCNFLFTGGVGYLGFWNNSEVYGKPRDVRKDKMAINLAWSGEYHLNRSFGVSASLNWNYAVSDGYSVTYHGETWEVERPSFYVWSDGYELSRLALTVGLNYHF